MSKRLALLWDIDGTLLSTARAGVPALEDGIESIAGTRPDLSSRRTAGMTDPEIVRSVLEEHRLPHDPDTVRRVLRAYADRLPERLSGSSGSLVAGIAETLADLACRDDVVSVLLTGNVRDGARAKLSRFGILDRFEHEGELVGAFSDESWARADIATAASRLVAARFGIPPQRQVVVGDTPLDVLAATSAGLACVGLPGGVHTAAELEAAGAVRVLELPVTARALMTAATTALATEGVVATHGGTA